MVHCHTVHLPLSALLIWCTVWWYRCDNPLRFACERELRASGHFSFAHGCAARRRDANGSSTMVRWKGARWTSARYVNAAARGDEAAVLWQASRWAERGVRPVRPVPLASSASTASLAHGGFNMSALRASLRHPAFAVAGVMVALLDHRGTPVWRGDVARGGAVEESWPLAEGASPIAGGEAGLSAARYEVHPVSSIAKALVSALFLLVSATHAVHSPPTPCTFPRCTADSVHRAPVLWRRCAASKRSMCR